MPKIPCPACGSSDARELYEDGHEHCFSCSDHTNPEDTKNKPSMTKTKRLGLVEYEVLPLTGRKLTEATCRKWDYGINADLGAQVANYYNKEGEKVGQKLRQQDKTFSWRGKQPGLLYGQWLWPTGGRKVVVTEGELDALSMSQAQDNKWPVVSLPNGAQSAKKALLANLEWLESFEEIVLMFDNDAPGQAAVAECVEVFAPGKCKIATLPQGYKDASDLLQAGKTELLVQAMWNARIYRPDGVVCGAEQIIEYIKKEADVTSLEYPWATLTEKTRGMRRGEMVLLCAGTGIGKSTVCRELAAHLIQRGEIVGYIALEESVARSALGLLSVFLNKRMHLQASQTHEEIQKAYNTYIGDKAAFYDHFGTMEIDALLSKMRFMVKSLGCTWIILDHISIAVTGAESDNERKDLDVAITKLRSFVQETMIGAFVVSHLSRRDKSKASHEEGGQVALRDLRGSHSLGQLPDMIFSFERDQQDEAKANYTDVRVLKNRFTGEVGRAGTLLYDLETGRLSEAPQGMEIIVPAGAEEDY